MDYQKILTKAIQKAIDGGWRWARPEDPVPTPELAMIVLKADIESPDGNGWKKRCCWETLVYSHPFAKALWGEREPRAWQDGEAIGIDFGLPSGWQYHLQQMVIADEPLKYLGDNL